MYEQCNFYLYYHLIINYHHDKFINFYNYYFKSCINNSLIKSIKVFILPIALNS